MEDCFVIVFLVGRIVVLRICCMLYVVCCMLCVSLKFITCGLPCVARAIVIISKLQCSRFNNNLCYIREFRHWECIFISLLCSVEWPRWGTGELSPVLTLAQSTSPHTPHTVTGPEAEGDSRTETGHMERGLICIEWEKSETRNVNCLEKIEVRSGPRTW